jgi:hypothetical protein
MNLDTGYCTIYSVSNDAVAGNMPVKKLALRHQSWYGMLNFETAPIRTTEAQQDVEISARIRVLQNRSISNHDIAVLSLLLEPLTGAPQFEITRAYHGVDEESGEPITDLTLRKVEQVYDITGIP